MSTKPQGWIVHAFTEGGGGGNPAGVVVDADGLDAAARLRIAARVGLSETAFVSASATETVRLEFFTPTRQIAHCGHATIATFALLRSLGRIGEGHLSKETIEGPRAVIVEGDRVSMEQRAPRFEPVTTGTRTAARITASLPATRLQHMTIVDTGNRFAVIEVASRADLAAANPDQAAVAEISESLDLVGYYLYSREGAPVGRVATTRMFAPRYGINEEAATGMAAGPLACVLFDRFGLGPTLTFEQGALMAEPSPSTIHVRLDLADGAIRRLFAGGSARVERRVAVDLETA
ncbi:PhzF family phenazine biosynthesis protein [Lysobacter sp. 2RAF19]